MKSILPSFRVFQLLLNLARLFLKIAIRIRLVKPSLQNSVLMCKKKSLFFLVHDSPCLYNAKAHIWFRWIMTTDIVLCENKLAQSISCNLTKYALYHNFRTVKCWCERFYNFTRQLMWTTKGKSFTSDFVVNVNISEDVFFF